MDVIAVYLTDLFGNIPCEVCPAVNLCQQNPQNGQPGIQPSMYLANSLDKLLQTLYRKISRLHRDQHTVRCYQGIDGDHSQRRHTINQDIIISGFYPVQVQAKHLLPAHNIYKGSFQSGKFDVGRNKVNPFLMVDNPLSRLHILVIDNFLHDID